VKAVFVRRGSERRPVLSAEESAPSLRELLPFWVPVSPEPIDEPLPSLRELLPPWVIVVEAARVGAPSAPEPAASSTAPSAEPAPPAAQVCGDIPPQPEEENAGSAPAADR
jgi:hypothetical protein